MFRIQYRLVYRGLRNYSAKPMVKEEKSTNDRLKDFEKITNIYQKTKSKEPQRPPFVKNFFLGIVDTDLLTYPQLTNEDLDNLNKSIKECQQFLSQPEIQENNDLSGDTLSKFAKQRLLGLQASQLMGGRELNVTELCRFTEEMSKLGLAHSLVNNENLGVQALIKFGSDSLKKKYLQRLVDGESISAFCLLEPASDSSEDLRIAKLSPDKKTWILNGTTSKIVNASNADIYLVFGCSAHVIKDGNTNHHHSLFVVERDFGGISSCKHNTIDENLQVSDVSFQDTPVPYDNIVGIENAGEKMFKDIYTQHRLFTAPQCSVLLKDAINNTVQHYIKVSKEPDFLYDTDAVRVKMAQLTESLYALDSVTYLTSGLLDKYTDQDCEVESTIAKVFASEQAFQGTKTCLELIGVDALTEKHWCSKLHKEAACHLTLNDSNDNLKIFIALAGVQHTGMHLEGLIKRTRNPLFNAAFVWKQMWRFRGHARDQPKLTLDLNYHLHPSTLPASECLEYCILRLQYTTMILLTRYGTEIISKHEDLRQLAECAIDIYAMTAAITRASRSYCIGLEHGALEIGLASLFAKRASERVKTKLNHLILGPMRIDTDVYKNISQKLFFKKSYFPMHPLTRNF